MITYSSVILIFILAFNRQCVCNSITAFLNSYDIVYGVAFQLMPMWYLQANAKNTQYEGFLLEHLISSLYFQGYIQRNKYWIFNVMSMYFRIFHLFNTVTLLRSRCISQARSMVLLWRFLVLLCWLESNAQQKTLTEMENKILEMKLTSKLKKVFYS